MVLNLEKEQNIIKMELLNTMEALLMINMMEKVHSFGKMANIIREDLKKGQCLEKV